MKQSSMRTMSSVSWSEPPEPPPRSPSVPSDCAPPRTARSPSPTSAQPQKHTVKALFLVYIYVYKKKRPGAKGETYNKFNVLLLDGNFGQLLLSAGRKTMQQSCLNFICQFASPQEKGCIGSHLSCLAFCSRDLLSPMTDIAWNQQRHQAYQLSGIRPLMENQLYSSTSQKSIQHGCLVHSTNQLISNWRLPCCYRHRFLSGVCKQRTKIQLSQTNLFLFNSFICIYTIMNEAQY